MTLHHQPDQQRYVLPVDGAEAYVSYRDEAGVRVLHHSFVPPELRGQKVGAELVRLTYEQLIADDVAARATCSYLVVLAKRNPVWRERFLG